MRNLSKVLSIAICITMILSCAACGKAAQDTSSLSDFVESEVNSQTSSIDGSSNTPSASSTPSKVSNNNSSQVAVGATTSKTWKEVISSMPKSLSGSTLKIASWNPVDEVKGARELVANFKKMTGIDVQWQTINYGEYTTQIAAMIASNKSPDIVRMHTLDAGDMSVLQPISASGYNFNDTAWSKSVSDFYTVNGKVYAVSLENTLFHQPNVVFYNRNLIAQYDLEDPYELWKKNKWTFDKFIEICRQYRDEAGDGCTPWSTDGLYDYANYMGTGFTRYDGTKFSNNLSDKKLLTAWQQTMKWVEEGVTSSVFWDQDGFNSGTVLFHTNGIIGARTTQAWFTKLKANGSLGVAPIPSISGQKYVVDFHEMEAYGIAKGAKNPKVVPYFLRYYLDAENYNADNFFVDKRALEVYNWTIKQGNYYMNYDGVVITPDSGYDKDLVSALKVSKPAQIATVLQSYNAVVNRAVQQTNDKLSKLK